MLPHLPLDRDTERAKLVDEVGLQYYRLGLRQLVENLMIQRMADNDRILTRYMDDKEFGDAAFSVLSKSVYGSIPAVGTPD